METLKDLIKDIMSRYKDDMHYAIDSIDKTPRISPGSHKTRSPLVLRTLGLIRMDRIQIKAREDMERRIQLTREQYKADKEFSLKPPPVYKSVWFHGPDEGPAFY